MITNGHGEGWRSSPVVELGVCPHLEKGKPDVGRGGMFPSEKSLDLVSAASVFTMGLCSPRTFQMAVILGL